MSFPRKRDRGGQEIRRAVTKFNRWLGSDPPPNLAEMLSVARAEQPDGRVLRADPRESTRRAL